MTLIEDWDENYTSKERANHEYYAPLMRMMAVKAYVKTEPEKAKKLIEYDLMSQEADMGISLEEKMKILAETYAVYADYLEAVDKEANIKEILSYRRTVASLYESLVLVHYNRVVIDGMYYKQTGEAYYKLAKLYAEDKQINAAIGNLEYALDYLLESNVYAYDMLCSALDLAEQLYTQVGDIEKATKCEDNLKYYRDEFLKDLPKVHPIDLREVAAE